MSAPPFPLVPAEAGANPRATKQPVDKLNVEDVSPDDVDNAAGDGDGADLPMTMSASVILSQMPRDASRALKEVEEMDSGKVTIRFKAVGSAPILRQLVFKISASSKFETVVNFLRKKLNCKPADSVFLYINSVFAPGLDEGVGNLFRVGKP